MTTREDLIYRQVFTLKDGARVLLRPLVREDRQALLELFLPVDVDERRYMRHDVSDPRVVESWIDGLDYDHVLPIVALVGDRLAGIASLHFLDGPFRHRAEIRMFLGKDMRQRGVGMRMLHALVELAKRRNLCLLEIQLITDQTPYIRAFQKAGFEAKCTFEDYFMFPDGELRDVALLVMHLRSPGDEF